MKVKQTMKLFNKEESNWNFIGKWECFNSPVLNKSYRKEREEYWIHRLGTAIPFGCNDSIKSIRNLK